MLTERRASILSLVVDEYVSTATPVSSQALVQRHRLGVSPATVRNEFARLEEQGLITHPHTSAGRVPSDLGYRFYVEALMAEVPVVPEEQLTIEHQFHQADGGLDEWLSLGASVLAGSVGNLAVVTRPQSRQARLKHVQLVHLQGASALVVAVMDDGRVEQRMLTLSQALRQDDLSRIAERLNALCAGQEASAAREAAEALSDEDEARLAIATAELIEEHRRSVDTYLDGIDGVLSQPEFSSSERMLQAVRHLAAYEVRRALPPPDEVDEQTIRAVIGSENGEGWLQEWSVVIGTYGVRDGAVGTIAVLGPTRMHYARTIPRVRYLAALMSNLLYEVGA